MTKTVYYEEPAISRFLFASPYMAPVWTVLRIWLGWSWFSSGWGKVQNPAWVGENAGAAITGYLQGALARAGGDAPSVAGWYAWMIENMFLPNAVLMGYLVAFGEVAVGVTLILGLLTGLSAARRRRNAEIALALVDLADRTRHKPDELSGGQQQRVAIARAIVSDPTLLICDEPTGDLDRHSADEILGLLQELNREHGKTIVMVTHDPRAASFASHTLHLDKGVLVEQPAHAG